MQSKWRVSGSLSGENPSSVVAGEPPPIPLQPPDPPDPTSPLPPQEFPTLSEAKSTPKPLPNYRFDTVSRSKTVPSVASKGTKQKTAAGLKTLASATIVPSATEEADTTPMLTDSEGDSVKNTIQEPGSVTSTLQASSTKPHNSSSLAQTEKAFCSLSTYTNPNPNPTSQSVTNQTPSQQPLAPDTNLDLH